MPEVSGIERLRVELDERGYDILIGPGLIARARYSNAGREERSGWLSTRSAV